MDTGTSTPSSDDTPLSDARMATLRTRREAFRELRERAATVFADAPAASFAGFRALIRDVMPTSPAERNDLSTRLGVHPDAIEWLLDGTLEWYDVDAAVIADLAWTLQLTRQTFVDLLVRDLNRDVAEGGGRPRRVAGWVEVTAPVLALWDEAAAAGGDRSERE